MFEGEIKEFGWASELVDVWEKTRSVEEYDEGKGMCEEKSLLLEYLKGKIDSWNTTFFKIKHSWLSRSYNL